MTQKLSKSKANWLSPQMRLYVLMSISKKKEIRCEKCGSYNNLEMHHKKYFPEHNVTVKDIQLLCNKCHRNAENKLSVVCTTFKDGKRFCEGSHFKFEY